MRTALQQLGALLGLLDSWGWRRVRDAKRFYLYSPPEDDENARFELVVPRDVHAADFDRAVANCIDAMASFYQTPFNSVEALLLPASEVVSIRLMGDEFAGGVAPFRNFERTLEHLKRAIARAASLVLTDDPLAQRIPVAAHSFLGDCWFLQTARGSFITRVALPISGVFGGLQYSLFAHPPARAEVAATLRSVTETIGLRVLSGEDTIFTEAGFDAVRGSVSVGLLEEMGRLLRGTRAQSLNLSFNRAGDEAVVPVPDLTEQRLARLDHFVEFVRERLHTVFPLDVTGTVFEVRRSPRRGSRAWVGLQAEVDGRLENITFKVAPEVLPEVLEHFRSRVPIRVRGRARRLRTQIRIESEFQYEE